MDLFQDIGYPYPMNKISKKNLIASLKANVQSELTKAKQAFESSQSLATSSEMKSEGKYDTRSIEAGYIAGAQQKRVSELELELGLLDEINIDHPPKTVSVGSLVEIELNGHRRFYFISSTGGGTILKEGEQAVMVISAFSPLGSEVIGLGVDDDFEVESNGEVRSYIVKSIR